jgi:chloramphenicol 3-O-phosphotransferase
VILFLNGSFGVGKTSVAKALVEHLPRSVRYNPEIFPDGWLWRLPRFIKLANRDTGDYQDMPLWRELVARTLRQVRRLAPVVIVPMAFSNRAYLREIMDKARTFDPDVQHFCLVAPLEVVEARLRKRGDAPRHLEWQLRRAKVCCEAHKSPDFAIRIEAADRGPEAIAREIARVTRIGHSALV